MLRNVLPLDRQIMTDLAEEYAEQKQQCPHLAGAAIMRGLLTLPEFSPQFGDDARREVLFTAAQSQALSFCNAVYLFLNQAEVAEHDIIEHLRSTGRMGKSLAKMESSAASNALTLMTAAPGRWVRLNDGKVHLTDYAINFFKRYSSATTGCPALGITVHVDDELWNEFDASWQAYVEEYIENYLLNGTPYVRPNIYSTLDA